MPRGMRRHIRGLARLLPAICLLCALTACQKAAQPASALDEAAITAALERAGLSGKISAEETMTTPEGDVTYVVRDPSEPYKGTDNPALVAGVTAGMYEGGRILSITFDRSVASEQVDWADWKRQLVFAAALYGDLEDEEVCRALLDKEVPAGEDRCRWEVPLTAGYCAATWVHRSQKTIDADGFGAREHHATLWVTLYASRSQYEALMTEQQSRTSSVLGTNQGRAAS